MIACNILTSILLFFFIFLLLPLSVHCLYFGIILFNKRVKFTLMYLRKKENKYLSDTIINVNGHRHSFVALCNLLSERD